MLEGLDVRTLALTNLLLGVVLGSGLLMFARAHPSVSGFRAMGRGCLILSLGLLLLALRGQVPDSISIILANTLMLSAIALISTGLLKYLKVPPQQFISLSTFLVIFSAAWCGYYLYQENNINLRVALLGTVSAVFLFYVAYKIKFTSDYEEARLLKLLRLSLIFGGSFFLFSSIWAAIEAPRQGIETISVIHRFSMIIMQLLIIEISFVVSWCASLNIENKLTQMAMRDPLTQLYNRRALQDLADKEISKAIRQNTSLAIILTDIDHFKRANDLHGHQIGDKVLANFAQRLKSQVRGHDIVARYGGEEFVVLLPDTDAANARSIADKLRLAIFETPIAKDAAGAPLNISASFGVSAMQGEHLNWDDMLGYADNALYQAKRAGRNTVRCKFEYIQLVAR